MSRSYIKTKRMFYHRRLTNELKKHPIEHHWDQEKDEIHFPLTGIGTVSLGGLERYPFRCPDIRINSKTYDDFLSFPSQTFRSLYQEAFPLSCCLRCTSFACPDRWRADYKMKDILEEIKKFARYKYTIFMKNLLNEIRTVHQLPDDIPIEPFLIPITG